MYPLDLSVAARGPTCTVFEFGNPNGDQNPKTAGLRRLTLATTSSTPSTPAYAGYAAYAAYAGYVPFCFFLLLFASTLLLFASFCF